MDEHQALLVDALAHIELHPDQWNQGLWGEALADEVSSDIAYRETVSDEVVQAQPGCKTAFCLAGWLCQLNGDAFHWKRDTYGEWTMQLKGGTPIPWRANVLLGLEVDRNSGTGLLDAKDDDLFSAGNNLDDLYAIGAEQLGLDEELLRKNVQERVNELAFVESVQLPPDER